MRPFVELDGVGVSYGEVLVLDGINLTVEPGDFLGIIGPNGSGKTTLLRVMLGLLQPQEGSVRLFGQPPAAFREWRRLGYVPQRAALDPSLPVTVGEVVATGLVASLGVFQRIGGKERARVSEALGRVGMEAHARTRIGALSTGQQQRVLIARALVSDPELIILDEPTLGLDVLSNRIILEYIRRERTNGKTIILSTHYLDEAETMCDTIGLLHDGRLVAEGDLRHLRTISGEERLSDIFLKLIHVDEKVEAIVP